MENEEQITISFGKKYLNCLKRGWSILAIFFVIGLLLGVLISSLTYKQKYIEENRVELTFRYSKEVQISTKDIISDENIARCKGLTKSLETGSNLKTYSYVDIHTIEIEKKDDYYILSADQDAFFVNADNSYSDVAAKGFLKHLTVLPFITDEEIKEYTESDSKGHSVFAAFDKTFYQENSLDQDGKIHVIVSNDNARALNQKHKLTYFSIWISSMSIGFLVIGFLFILIFIGKLDMSVVHIYDNKNIYRTPFHRSYWKASASSFKDIKSLCMMAILLALALLTKLITIPSGFGNLGISLGLIFLSVVCMLYGPCPALLIGALSDVLGYMMKPDGTFFIGYTFQAMFACFCYGICLYKTHITFSRCLLSRVLINLIANVVIGGFSWGIYAGLSLSGTFTYMLTISLPKNLVYLLPQSLLIFIVIKALAKPMEQAGILTSDIADNISFF